MALLGALTRPENHMQLHNAAPIIQLIVPNATDRRSFMNSEAQIVDTLARAVYAAGLKR